MKKNIKVKKIKGTEGVYGVFIEGKLVYESDKVDCLSYAKGL